MGVVVIGNSQKIENLMYFIDNDPSYNKYKFGFHFILTDAFNQDTNVFNHNSAKFGQGTISIALSNEHLSDFYDEMTEKYK